MSESLKNVECMIKVIEGSQVLDATSMNLIRGGSPNYCDTYCRMYCEVDIDSPKPPTPPICSPYCQMNR